MKDGIISVNAGRISTNAFALFSETPSWIMYGSNQYCYDRCQQLRYWWEWWECGYCLWTLLASNSSVTVDTQQQITRTKYLGHKKWVVERVNQSIRTLMNRFQGKHIKHNEAYQNRSVVPHRRAARGDIGQWLGGAALFFLLRASHVRWCTLLILQFLILQYAWWCAHQFFFAPPSPFFKAEMYASDR